MDLSWTPLFPINSSHWVSRPGPHVPPRAPIALWANHSLQPPLYPCPCLIGVPIKQSSGPQPQSLLQSSPPFQTFVSLLLSWAVLSLSSSLPLFGLWALTSPSFSLPGLWPWLSLSQPLYYCLLCPPGRDKPHVLCWHYWDLLLPPSNPTQTTS